MPSRVPTHKYTDPLDHVWVTAARRIGFRVERTRDAYAATPGGRVLLLGDPASLDADDSLAQMILHELCHSLVEGEASFDVRDWGLDNETERDVPREEACLRLQAALTARHGLRRFFAPTTDFRAFYDALAEDPLSPRNDPTITMAVLGFRRADKAPWAPHLRDALEATAAIALRAHAFTSPENGTRDDAPAEQDLYSVVDAPPRRHPTGLPGSAHRAPSETCGTCTWRTARGRCRQADGARVDAALPACERFEPELDCRDCGACCRAAYDTVQVGARDPVRKKHPELVVVRGPFLEIARRGDRCSALFGGEPGDAGAPPVPFTCSIYEDRPKSCRDFERSGEHCLTARRRLGLTL